MESHALLFSEKRPGQAVERSSYLSPDQRGEPGGARRSRGWGLGEASAVRMSVRSRSSFYTSATCQYRKDVVLGVFDECGAVFLDENLRWCAPLNGQNINGFGRTGCWVEWGQTNRKNRNRRKWTNQKERLFLCFRDVAETPVFRKRKVGKERRKVFC